MSEDVAGSGLSGADLQGIFSRVTEIFLDPTSNLTAALLLYGIIGLLVLIVIVIIVMLVLSSPEEEQEPSKPQSEAPARREPAAAPQEVEVGSTAVTVAIVVGVLALVWISAGYSTAQKAVCTGCHVNPPHAEAVAADDPHVDTSCVGCHEPGGLVGQYLVNVPFRAAHFADGMVEASLKVNYGRPTESACLSCHQKAIGKVTVNEERGLIMSHSEPLAASASCLDCHKMREGVVGPHNVGMNTCLKCHDAETASSECSTCHKEQGAQAARARTSSFASVQVKQVRCGGCHDERRQCDPCHGVRLPHDREFMAYAHARSAAVDFWFGDGSTCSGSSCHTATRRPCAKCHGSLLGRGHGPTLANWHQKGSSAGCNRCHQVWALTPRRDFCADVCHSEAALKYSPR